MRLRFTSDDGVARMQAVTSRLAEGQARMVMARAVNHTGRKANTGVVRGLVQQTSAPRRAVIQGLRTQRAATRGAGPIAFVISARHAPLPLKLFRARQNAIGVVARVWGRSKTYRSSFIVQSIGAHVFKRAGASRFPIRQKFGPSMATELVKDQSRAAFQRVMLDLPGRVDHELQRVLR